MIKLSRSRAIQRVILASYFFCKEKQTPKIKLQKDFQQKITFGSNYFHPLHSVFGKIVRSPRKIKKIKKQFEKQDQNYSYNQQNKKIVFQKQIAFIAIIVLGCIFLFILFLQAMGPAAKLFNALMVPTQTVQFGLDLIRKIQDPVNIIVRTRGFQNCLLIINKEETVIYKESELAAFLQAIEKEFPQRDIKVDFILDFQDEQKKPFAGTFPLFMIIAGYAFIKLRRRAAGSKDSFTSLFEQQKFQPIKPDTMKIFFKDVAGLHEAKFEVTQFVDFLKVPEKYLEMGAKIPKGALMTGPPGTGKTLLAKACAGEAGVPFYYVSGSDFVEKYAGLGASRVRSLFDEAEKNSPSIIFIDEIDAIGKKRDSGPFSNEERDNTLNQLLVRMDGFETKSKVVVMGATNRKDMLDPALLRPGRFDRAIEIGLPNFEERKEILKVHLKKVKYDSSLTEDEVVQKISVLTPGFSGAELANVCNEAAILAARENKDSIPLVMFEKATERVMAGLQRRNMFTDQEKDCLAFYECGKAVTSWFTAQSDPIIKISILPFSKSSKGYSHSIKDETSLHTKDELLAKVCCYLAGRASEQHFKGYITTNGDTDLQRAKKIISLIVTKFGMSESLKMIAFPDIDFTRKPYSEATQTLIDSQINKLTEECQKRVENLIKEKEDKIMELKDRLLKKQTLTHQCLKEVLGERPSGSNNSYEIFVKEEEKEIEKGNEGPVSGVGVQFKQI